MNPGNLRPFTKGDPRINRKGRVRSFDHLRTLAKEILGQQLVDPDGKRFTVLETILRRLAQSKDPVANRIVLEYAFGKVPDKLEATGLENRTTLVLHYAHERKAIEERERGNHEREKTVLALPPSSAQ